MKHYRKRITKIVDELLTYYLNRNSTDLKIQVQNLEDQYKITIRGNCPNLTERDAEEVVRLLNTPTSTELEEYYWELVGESDVDTELTLIGMMTTEAEVDYKIGEYLEITLYRTKC